MQGSVVRSVRFWMSESYPSTSGWLLWCWQGRYKQLTMTRSERHSHLRAHTDKDERRTREPSCKHNVKRAVLVEGVSRKDVFFSKFQLCHMSHYLRGNATSTSRDKLALLKSRDCLPPYLCHPMIESWNHFVITIIFAPLEKFTVQGYAPFQLPWSPPQR